MIRLTDVKKQYGSGKEQIVAVDGVTLDVAEGEIFGIIGYSGAGKSSLIRLLNGLEKPTSGAIKVGPLEISSIKGEKLRKARQKVSMIFQHFNLLWSRTVKDNIAFPLEISGMPKKDREKKVLDLIELVGLTGRENSYPSELSGGQKQRVGIARALANDPEVLLCDEATSALDPETTDGILDMLTEINERMGLTIVLITHEMHVIQKICHRVAVMEAGRVVEMGPVLDVFQAPQQAITKRFVSQVTESVESKEVLRHIKEAYPEGKVIRLTFVGEQTEQPVLASLIRRFEIEVNIVQGSISPTKGGSYGTLILQLVGKEALISEAIQYLNEQNVQTEVIPND